MELISTGTVATLASDLGANVASSIGSVWVIGLLAISIPLTFYIVKRIMGMFSK